MDEDITNNDITETPADVSRRAFIKGVIGSGATPTTPVRVIELVLAQTTISSQLIDSLNASMYLRAGLTDLFLLNDIVTMDMGTAVATQ